MEVFGTSAHAAHPDAELRYTAGREASLKKLISLDAKGNSEGVLKKILDKKPNPNDYFAPTVDSLPGLAKFDLIVDSYGEVYYANKYDEEVSDTNYTESRQRIENALKNLNPGCSFFVGICEPRFYKYLWEHLIKILPPP